MALTSMLLSPPLPSVHSNETTGEGAAECAGTRLSLAVDMGTGGREGLRPHGSTADLAEPCADKRMCLCSGNTVRQLGLRGACLRRK